MINITQSSGFRSKEAIPCYLEIIWRKYKDFPYQDMGFTILVATRQHIDNATQFIPTIPENDTIKMIKSKFTSHDDSFDAGVMISELKCKISCPLTLCKLKDFPAKFLSCNHIDCFDVRVYLQMNYKRPTSWKCPICQKLAPWESLRICEWTKNVSKETDDETKEVYLTKMGGWKLPSPKKEVKELEDDARNFKQEHVSSPTRSHIKWNKKTGGEKSSTGEGDETIIPSDDEEGISSSKKPSETICLDSDSDDGAPIQDPLEDENDPFADILAEIKNTEEKLKEGTIVQTISSGASSEVDVVTASSSRPASEPDIKTPPSPKNPNLGPMGQVRKEQIFGMSYNNQAKTVSDAWGHLARNAGAAFGLDRELERKVAALNQMHRFDTLEDEIKSPPSFSTPTDSFSRLQAKWNESSGETRINRPKQSSTKTKPPVSNEVICLDSD